MKIYKPAAVTLAETARLPTPRQRSSLYYLDDDAHQTSRVISLHSYCIGQLSPSNIPNGTLSKPFIISPERLQLHYSTQCDFGIILVLPPARHHCLHWLVHRGPIESPCAELLD